jgi:DNA-binding IclR family transcriptional regulator
LKKFTVKTEIDPGRIRKEYEEIRTSGFAYDKGEYDDDVYAVAAPVFNHEDHVVAAVVIVAPSFRMGSSIESGSLELLKDTASAISGRLLKV